MCQQWIAAASESGLFLLIILFGNKYNLSISWCIVFHKLRHYEVFGTVDLPFGMGGCSCFFLEDWVHTNECSRNKYFPFNWLLEKLYNYNLLYFKISFYSFKTVLATVLKKNQAGLIIAIVILPYSWRTVGVQRPDLITQGHMAFEW